MRRSIPQDFDPRTVSLTVDVEWAHPSVLDDLRTLLDERGLRATFFVTHDGVSVPGHERGIHPNFRYAGDALGELRRSVSNPQRDLDDGTIYEHVVSTFMRFAPEALGVRGHSLHYDSQLLPVYRRHGLEYDSTYQIPLLAGLQPFWKECGILEIPIYLNDYFELKTNAIGFDAGKIDLDAPGLKVFNMHPNLMFLNAASMEHYISTKSFYHDVDRLRAARHSGRGSRTMMIDLLDKVVQRGHSTMTLGQINALWRTQVRRQ